MKGEKGHGIRTTFKWFRKVNYTHIRSVASDSSWPHGLQHARIPCLSPTPGACSNQYPSRWWCHPTISSSVVPFSHLQSFPAARSFPMSCFFATGGQSFGVFSFSISSFNEYSVLISFRIDWLDLLAVQGKSVFTYLLFSSCVYVSIYQSSIYLSMYIYSISLEW